MKETFKVEGMTCSNCKRHVEESLNDLNGVNNAVVNLSLNNVTIDYKDELLSKSDFVFAVKEAGYTLVLDELKKTSNKPFIISIVLSVILMILAMSQMFNARLISDPFYFALTQTILCLIVMVLNYKYFTTGFKSLFKFKSTMNSLIAIGSSAAFIYGVYLLVLIKINQVNGNEALVMEYTHNLYFETAAIILTLVSIGKKLEERAKKSTVRAINELIKSSPKTATLLNGNEVKVEDLKIGDIVVIKPGDTISADGVVVKGNTFIDESSITGESALKSISLESKVFNGTKNIDGYIEVEVLKENKDSSFQKIIQLVLEASNSKARISTLADKISNVFVPVVILISIVTFVVWNLITKNFETSFSFALAVLVISCPCALGLATPVAINASIGLASKRGILIKSANYLEQCKNVDYAIFDKTGTITEGKPKLVDFVQFSDNAKEVVCSLEDKSTHPLAIAILNEFEDTSKVNLDDYKNEPGFGVNALVGNKRYYFGSLKYVDSIKVTITDEQSDVLNKFHNEGKTVSCLFSDKIDAIFTFNDKIKKDAFQLIEELHKHNVKTVMLTGDNETSAKLVASEVGIDEVKYNLLPSDKAEIVKEYTDKGLNVMMVGDGINDTVALVNASIGVAVSNGSELAMESANVIVKENSILDVVNIINISKRTFKLIKENLFFAFIYNVIAIPLSAGVYFYAYDLKLTPMIATVLMNVSSLFVVLNALRINRTKFINSNVPNDVR